MKVTFTAERTGVPRDNVSPCCNRAGRRWCPARGNGSGGVSSPRAGSTRRRIDASSLPERTSVRHGHSGRVAEREDRLRARHPLRFNSIAPVSMGPPPLLRRCRVREWAIAQA